MPAAGAFVMATRQPNLKTVDYYGLPDALPLYPLRASQSPFFHCPGKFRYRATAPGNVTLLRTKQQLLEVKPGSQAPIMLRAQPAGCTQDRVGTNGHQVLVTDYNKKKKRFSLLRVAYK